MALVLPQNEAGGSPVPRRRHRRRRRCRRWWCRRRTPTASSRRGGPGRAVHPDVAAGAVDAQGLGAAGAAGGGVDRGPVAAVGRGLDLERAGVGRLPVQGHLADGLGRAQVDLEPLRVAERAGPAGAGVAVDRVGGRVGRALGGRGGGRVVQRRVGGVAGGAGAAGGPVDLELAQAVAVLGAADGPVHPHVAAGAADVQGLGAAGAAGGRVDRGPVGVVGRGLDLERLGVGGLPVQRHLADGGAGAQIDLQPLRVAERAGPAGAGVPVHRGRGRERGVLHRRGGGRLALGKQGRAGRGVLGLDRALVRATRRDPGEHGHQGQRGHQGRQPSVP